MFTLVFHVFGEEELAASAGGEEWARKVILVLSVLRLVFFLLLLQHDETRMLHVHRKYVSIPCKCTCN